MNLKGKIRNNRWNIIIWIIYAVVTFIISIIFHEKWRDEGQAWLIARDLNIVDIIKQMNYEGHPPLWHFILVPFAKLGFPYITQSIISWGIMCITAWLILTKSPFRKEIQVLILSSMPFLYLYPAIARNYSLIPLAIVLIAIYYPTRAKKTIQYSLSILLLAFTHINMLGLVGILYLFFFLEQIFYSKKDKKAIQKLFIGLSISIIGLLCLVCMLWGSTTTNTQLSTKSIFQISLEEIRNLITMIQINLFGAIAYSTVYSAVFKIFLFAFTIFLIICMGKKNPQSLIIAAVAIEWQMFIYLCIYADRSLQKVNTLFLIYLFIAWINCQKEHENDEKKSDKIIRNIIIIGSLILLILNCIEGIAQIKFEINKNYSYAGETAKYIEENLEEDAILICTNGPYASAIIPYTENKRYWNPSSKQYYTYMTWDSISNTVLEIDEIVEIVKNNFKESDKVYLLRCNYEKESDKDAKILKLQEENVLSEVLYSSGAECYIYNETYQIYEFNLQK